MLTITDQDRVRLLTLDRPDALNAFNEALYDALAEALIAAGTDDAVAVVVITGTGRAFSAGQDLLEMAERITDPDFVQGVHGFPGLIDQLAAFPKPLLLAVNGLGLGIGATIIGFAELVFMADDARLKCPFTSLGVAPEAASSLLFPQLLGHQNAAWVLLSAEWIGAEEAERLGLVWKVTTPETLLEVTMAHATKLAAMPISSLIAVKATMTAGRVAATRAARDLEDAQFQKLMGGPANMEALAAFADRRPADFTNLPPGW
ncbi:MAG: enoyl-CoA hydratase-related protein [Acidimicrobiales bacterium]